MKTYPPDSVPGLLQEVARGDEAAFRALYDRYQHRLLVYITRITRQPEMAEEIVADIFVKLWFQREKLEEVQNFDTYLFVISRNHTYSVLRKLMIERQRIEAWSERISAEGETDARENIDELYAGELAGAMDTLTDLQRKVWDLKKHGKLTYRQIGEQIGISPETVKKHLEAASRKIQAYLTQHIRLAQILILVPLEMATASGMHHSAYFI